MHRGGVSGAEERRMAREALEQRDQALAQSRRNLQLEALSRYHVTLIQGDLTGRPVDPETFAERYLNTQHVGV